MQKFIFLLLELFSLLLIGIQGEAHFKNISPDSGLISLTNVEKRNTIKEHSSKSILWENNYRNFTVEGKVTDSTGNPLVGVTVNLKGTSIGTITNTEGVYSLNIPNSTGTLIFSYVGYQTGEISIKGHLLINVILKPLISSLDQLVVVAMGKQKKENVLGSISSVDIGNIRNIPTTSVTNAIAGRMAGAVTVQRSGEIGQDATSFWIRGISTFGSNQSPLILVDGVERSLSDVSLNEIQSISILKDAAATAVYGSRAANGVVLITTREGNVGAPQVEVNLQYGLTDLPTMPKYIGGVGYAELYNEAFGQVNYTPQYIQNLKDGTNPYLYPNVNWFNEIFKKFSQNSLANIDMHGGGTVAQYFVNFGYYNEVGNFRNDPTNDYKSNEILNKYSYRSNVNIRVFPTTKVSLQVGGYLSDLNMPGLATSIYGQNFTPAQAVFYWANQATPISNPVRVPIDTLPNGKIQMGWGSPTQVGEMNPAQMLMGSGYNTEFQSQLLTQLIIDQDLSSITDGLSAKFSYSFDDYNNTSIDRDGTASTYGVVGVDSLGRPITTEVNKGSQFLGYSNVLSSNRAEELKAQINYQKVISSKQNVTGMFTYYQRDYRVGGISNSVLALPQREQGLAFRGTYSYADRYLLEVDAGYNGSENFAKGHRFGFFPAVAAGWIVSKESFWKNLDQTINFFKLKGSVGLVGAQALPGGNRFAYLTVYGGGLGGYSFGGPSPTNYSGVGLERAGIDNLTWETGLIKDVDAQVQLFNGTIALDVDYFHELRTHILTQRISIPSMIGLPSVPYANIGKMENHGIEGTLSISKSFAKDASVRLYGNFSYIKNKILNMDEPSWPYPYERRTGHPLGQEFGLISLGYFTDSAEILKSPTQTFGPVRPGDVRYKDVNGDGQITVDDEVPIGYSTIPEINYGFGIQTEFKNFDLGVFFRGEAKVTYPLGGAYIPFSQGVGKLNLYVQTLNRWTPQDPNPNVQYPRIFNGESANNWQPSTKNIYNGSFVRLQNIELGYTFNSHFLKKHVGVKRLRLYLVSDNVLLFSKWKMWDPETGTDDGSNYPPSRDFNFGVKVDF